MLLVYEPAYKGPEEAKWMLPVVGNTGRRQRETHRETGLYRGVGNTGRIQTFLD